MKEYLGNSAEPAPSVRFVVSAAWGASSKEEFGSAYAQ
jgi:hypothetical protein